MPRHSRMRDITFPVSPSFNQSTIDYALERNMIRYGTTELDEKLIAESEFIIFALYPTVFIKWIEEHQHLFSPGTLITDVTGVKGSVVAQVQSMLRGDVEFISAHPSYVNLRNSEACLQTAMPRE